MTPTSRLCATVMLACAGAVALSGCVTTSSASTKRDVRDPLERVNRATFAFNDALDRSIVRPVARGYRKVTPRIVRTGISNFFANISYPTVIVNGALQGKFRESFRDTGRFMLNTTIGIGGLADPATQLGLDANDEDFGQTLGRWGVRTGPYLVVPFFGPYTLRDGLGDVFDQFTKPRSYLEDDSTRYSLFVADQLERRVSLLDADNVLDRAGDPYSFVRSAYLQRREYLVRDGAVEADPDMVDPELELEEDSAADQTAPAPSKPQ